MNDYEKFIDEKTKTAADCVFKHPSDLDASQCLEIPAYRGEAKHGNLDGAQFVVVAWLPTPDEIEQLINGHPVYLTMLGGLAPHFLTTDFKQATNI